VFVGWYADGMTDVISRRTGRPKVRKTTISLSPEAFEAAHAEMAARGIPTLSAYLDWVLTERKREQDFNEILDEMLAENPPTDEEREWARRVWQGDITPFPSRSTPAR
jgi:hypothetical protein